MQSSCVRASRLSQSLASSARPLASAAAARTRNTVAQWSNLVMMVAVACNSFLDQHGMKC